jgi:N-acetylglucosaminyldiphosphoundecaprenol N-acetyl-beta-D-mannosaminyltransferase
MIAPPDICAASAAPPRRADFGRALVCILGLPFDAVDIAQAVQRIRDAASTGRRCFVSTPNLNFAMAARHDAAFRDSVLHSDLSLVDGMPLVWIARALGQPLRERVSGADVFEALQAHAGPPLDVYLFGGPPGAAAQACDRINQGGGGLRCVGFDAAGFGSIEAMSSDEQIARINRSGARFVVVALGAAKGQAWIEYNAPRLAAPVLSHLGAVVNFAAGTVRRAPRWTQAIGLEWLWRIKEEPALWRRYRRDGVAALGLLLTRVLPDAIEARHRPASAPARLEVLRAPHGRVLQLHGDWRGGAHLDPLRSALTALAADDEPGLDVDLASVTGIGPACTALLLVARGWWDTRGGFEVVASSAAVRATLRRQLAARALLGTD